MVNVTFFSEPQPNNNHDRHTNRKRKPKKPIPLKTHNSMRQSPQPHIL